MSKELLDKEPQNSKVVELAKNIVSTQRDEIKQMKILIN